jgi:two-component system sensor histidine kinase KdpD
MEGRAAAAAENFFKDTHLTALRELALRFVAEHVDKRLRELRSVGTLKTVWRSGERLLVAVGPEPVRRRSSSAGRGAWPRPRAPHGWPSASSPPSPLDEGAQRSLEQNLSLARELGAEVVVTHDDDVAQALVRVALQNNATQIVVGKSRNPRGSTCCAAATWSTASCASGVRSTSTSSRPSARRGEAHDVDRLAPGGRPRPAREYAEVFGVLAALTVASWFIVPHSGYLSVGLFYLLAVIVLSLRVGPGPVFVAGRRERAHVELPLHPAPLHVRDRPVRGRPHVRDLLRGRADLRPAHGPGPRAGAQRAHARGPRHGALPPHAGAQRRPHAGRRRLRRAAGRPTPTSAPRPRSSSTTATAPPSCPTSPAPSRSPTRSAASPTGPGATARRPGASRTPSPPPRASTSRSSARTPPSASSSCGCRPRPRSPSRSATWPRASPTQLAQLVEREQLRAAGEREKLLAESDKLHRTLLDGVSHELKTPLAVLSAAVENLAVRGRGHARRASPTRSGRPPAG